ncbi:conjugal transfer protein [Streptomyces smyrnaeus]
MPLTRPSSGERPEPPVDPPATAAGQKVRFRSVLLGRVLVYAALATGPAALAVACASGPAVVRSEPSATAQRGAQSEHTADPAGYAALFVDLWSQGSGTAQLMAPDVPVPEWGEEAPSVERVHAVRSTQVRKGAWSVTVAVQLVGDSPVRFFTVPVATRSGQKFAVTAAPAEVAVPKAPSGGEEPPYRKSVPTTSPLASTVRDFLNAYAGGSGAAERYLAPGASLPPLAPSPYEKVTVERLMAAGRQTQGEVGKDGFEIRVRAEVTARDTEDREWPLTYGLRLAARDGRWEVRALESGLEESDGAKASSATSAAHTDLAGASRTKAGW